MKVETNNIFVYAKIMAGKTLKMDERIINLRITAYFILPKIVNFGIENLELKIPTSLKLHKKDSIFKYCVWIFVSFALL